MLRPQDTSTRERKNLDGLWDFALDPGRVGRDQSWAGAALAGARSMAVPASFNDVSTDAAVRDHIGPVWYQRSVLGPGAAGPVAASCCTSSRPPTGRRCGSTTSRWCRTRAATPRSRPTSPTYVTPGAVRPDHRRGRQHPDLPDHPARRRRGHPARPPAALLARLLQLRRPAPHRSGSTPPPRTASRTSPWSPAWTATTGTVGLRRRDRGRRGGGGHASCCATPTGTEVATADGAAGHADRPRGAPLGTGRRLPLRPRASSWSSPANWSTATTRASGSARSGSTAPAS